MDNSRNGTRIFLKGKIGKLQFMMRTDENFIFYVAIDFSNTFLIIIGVIKLRILTENIFQVLNVFNLIIDQKHHIDNSRFLRHFVSLGK